jgi:hypothetical protein
MFAAAAFFLLLLTWFPCPIDGAVPAGATGNRIDFEDIPAGNVVVAIGPDITINAFYEPFDVNPHPLLNSLPVCFDSSKPGSGEKQVALGSPYVLIMHYAGLFANLVVVDKKDTVCQTNNAFFIHPPQQRIVWHRWYGHGRRGHVGYAIRQQQVAR